MLHLSKKIVTRNLVLYSCFSPDSKELIITSHYQIDIWHLNENKISTFATEEKPTKTALFSSSKELLFLGMTSGIIKVWNFLEKKELHNCISSNFKVTALFFDDIKQTLYAGGEIGNFLDMYTWNRNTLTYKKSIENGYPISAINKYDQDTLIIFSKKITFWDIKLLKEKKIFSEFKLRNFFYTIDNLLISQDINNYINIYDITTKKLLFKIPFNGKNILFSQKNSLIMFINLDILCIFSLTTGKIVFQITLKNKVISLSLSEKQDKMAITTAKKGYETCIYAIE